MSCTTHHHACDCREAKFKELESKLAKARAALRTIAAQPDYHPLATASHQLARDTLAEIEGGE